MAYEQRSLYDFNPRQSNIDTGSDKVWQQQIKVYYCDLWLKSSFLLELSE